MIKKRDNRLSLFYSLADMLDQSHPLYLLADKIDWTRFHLAGLVLRRIWCTSAIASARAVWS